MLFSLFLLGGLYPPARAQCPTLTEIRSALGDSTLCAGTYVAAVHDGCPTAADSLSTALYSRALYHYGLGDRAEAARFMALAREEYGKIDTTLQLGKVNFNLGMFNFLANDFREALYYLRQAAQIFPRVDHPQSTRRWLQSLEEIGLQYARLGDYRRAEEQFLATRREAERRGYDANAAQLNIHLSSVYEKTGQLGAAAGALDAGIAGTDDSYLLALARLGRVSLNHERGRYAAAEEELLDLLNRIDRLDDYNQARLFSLGILLALERKDTLLADSYFENNLLAARRYDTPELRAQAWDNGAEIALATNDYPLAIDRLHEAVALLVPGFKPGGETMLPTGGQLAGAGSKVFLVQCLRDLARALSGAGKREEALAALYAVDRVIDQLRAGLGGEVSALFWREEALPVYERAIARALSLGKLEEAFYFFEKSRAVLLLEGLAEADLRRELPRAAERTLAAAERAVREHESYLLEGAGDADSLLRRGLVLREELLDVRAVLTERYPRLRLNGAAAEVTGLQDAEARLAAAGYGMQLQYFVGEEKTYLLVVARDGNHALYTLGPTQEVLDAVRPFLGYFTDAEAIDRDPEGFDAAARLAYRTLIAPAAPPEKSPLLIVPDGLLSYLPFAALKPDGRYLIARNPVSYAQSTTLFARTDHPANDNALAFVPFATDGRKGAPALPFTAAEANALTDLFPTTRLSSAAAARAALLDSLPFGILHLGTHAEATRTEDAAPRILTATDPLYLTDVYGMRLDGALVTLSACNSNVGPLARGEGVLGLGRAFRAAGASGVVASLWPLNDRATADITSRFYAELAGGRPKPLALHAAQLAYLERDDLPAYLKSPYYWAGLTYYGDAQRMNRPFSSLNRPWLLGGGVVLGIMLVLVGKFGGPGAPR